MSWQKYTPVARARPETPVSISIPDEDTRATPFILIDEATVKALGWKADSRIMLSIGTAEHDGKLRLEPAAGEPLRLLPPKGVVKRHRITVGRLPCLGTDRVRGACGYEVEKVTGGGAPLWSLRFPTRRARTSCHAARQRPSPRPAVREG